jgi:hypothetical protein
MKRPHRIQPELEPDEAKVKQLRDGRWKGCRHYRGPDVDVVGPGPHWHVDHPNYELPKPATRRGASPPPKKEFLK